MFFFFSIMGNKTHEIHYIEDDVCKLIDEGQIHTIVEPFCGSASVSLHFYRKYGDKLNYHINDNDAYLIQFMNRVRDGTEGPILNFVNEKCVGLTKDIYNKIIKQDGINAWFFKNKVHGYRIGLFPTKRKYGNYDWTKYKHYYNFLRSPTLKITCKDYTDIFNQYKNDTGVLLFIDPPYLNSFNALYNVYNGPSTIDNIIQDRTKMYIDILDVLKSSCKCLSIQNGNYMIKYIYNGFVKKSYMKKYKLTQNITEHIIISNIDI